MGSTVVPGSVSRPRARAAAVVTTTTTTTTSMTTAPNHRLGDSFEGRQATRPLAGDRTPPSAALPVDLATDVADLRPAIQADLHRLLNAIARRPDHAEVLADVVEALRDPALWPQKPSENDERRLLATAIGCVPVVDGQARPGAAPTTRFISATTTGRAPIAGAAPEATIIDTWRTSSDDVVMAPEWFFVPADGVALSARDKDALLDRLRVLTRGSDRLLIPGTIPWQDDDGGYHNTAYAISDGRILHSVDKRGDGDDGDIARSAGLTHVADDGGSVFSWRGLDVGLEVCRDHGDARLRFELLDALAHPRGVVDLQLVVSSGVWLKHAAVGVGGQVAVAQGDGVAGHERAVRTAVSLEFADVTP